MSTNPWKCKRVISQAPPSLVFFLLSSWTHRQEIRTRGGRLRWRIKQGQNSEKGNMYITDNSHSNRLLDSVYCTLCTQICTLYTCEQELDTLFCLTKKESGFKRQHRQRINQECACDQLHQKHLFYPHSFFSFLNGIFWSWGRPMTGKRGASITSQQTKGGKIRRERRRRWQLGLLWSSRDSPSHCTAS